jgi:hypothetical protein
MGSAFSWLGRSAIAVLMIVGLPKFAHADFIDLVSQSYHIHQRAQGPGEIFDFEQTSPVPISHSATDSIDGGTYRFAATTDGGVTSNGAFVTFTHSAEDLGNVLVTAADTSAAITFRPLVNNLVVQTAYPGGPPPPFGPLPPLGSASLFDDTVGLGVLTFPPYPPGPSFVSLNMDHLYTISASISALNFLGAGVTLSIAPVPESESTLTFLVVGLGALFILARSQMFRLSQ